MTAEFVQIGAVRMDEPARLRRHRRSHLARHPVLPRVPEERGARAARPSSTTRSGGAPTTSSSTTRSRRGSASRCRRRCCCRTRSIRRTRPSGRCAICSTRSTGTTVFDYVGFPAFLKPFDGGGWRDVYKVRHAARSSSPPTTRRATLCMTLQRGGQLQGVLPLLRRRAGEGAHHAVRSARAASTSATCRIRRRTIRTLLARVERDALTLCRALGYDLNTVEFAVEDGVPYAIDFMNPAPDADLHSVARRTSTGSSNAVADLAVQEGARAAARRRRYRWDAVPEPG